MSEPRKPTSSFLSARSYARTGTLSVIIFIFLIFGWGAFASLSGAIIARGVMVVQSDAKKIQHPYGGIVSKIHIKNGDFVKSGDILVRLDETSLLANATALNKSLAEFRVRRARLLAERDGLEHLIISSETMHLDPILSETVRSELRLFELRAQMRSGRKEQIEERIKQLASEVAGYEIQRDSVEAQIKFINQELEASRQLWNQQLITLSRVNSLEREAARLDGMRGQLIANISQTAGKITEARLSILQIDRDLTSEVGSELRELDGKIAPLEEQLIAAHDQLARVVVTSPVSGIVHQLQLKTVGGVVGPGEVMMLIIPAGDSLVIDAQVNPAEIDQVKIGATTVVRLTALSQRRTPELLGLVEHISADAVTDQRSGASFFMVRINFSNDQIHQITGLTAIPGMPVEVFIKTGDRQIYEIVLKPITDQLKRAYRQL